MVFMVYTQAAVSERRTYVWEEGSCSHVACCHSTNLIECIQDGGLSPGLPYDCVLTVDIDGDGKDDTVGFFRAVFSPRPSFHQPMN
eukprot:473190-Amorphochlora_amoeboformis.AAC.2